MSKEMTLKEYEEKAMSTAVFPEEYAILYPALKLAGEAGEVAEKIGKVLRDNNGVFDDKVKLKIAKELGDVLWYIPALAKGIGFDLEEIARMNIEKLSDRKNRNQIQGSGDER